MRRISQPIPAATQQSSKAEEVLQWIAAKLLLFCCLWTMVFTMSQNQRSSLFCPTHPLLWRFRADPVKLIPYCWGLARLARSVSLFCCVRCQDRLVCPATPNNQPDSFQSRSIGAFLESAYKPYGVILIIGVEPRYYSINLSQ
jgi:hypothetical protein